MKKMLAVVAMFCINTGWAAEVTPSLTSTVLGEVLEIQDVESYSYLRLKTKEGETWAAVSRALVKKGDKVTIENAMVMHNFQSKTLQKKFDRIVFGTLAGQDTRAAVAGGDMATQHAGVAKAVGTSEAADVKVAKAKGAEARTVAEIIGKRSELKDRPILVRGKVVKYTSGVLGRNWIHLRDGSGSAAAETNDVLVTTRDEAKLGDVVTVKGTVRTDMDLGSGYFYKVLVEAGALQK